MTFVKDVYQT